MTPRERAEALFRIEPARHDGDDWHAVDCGAGDDELALFGSRAAAEAYVKAHAAPIAAAIESALAERDAGEAERVREAVAREREACAQLVERFDPNRIASPWLRPTDAAPTQGEIADAIRARATSPAPEAATWTTAQPTEDERLVAGLVTPVQTTVSAVAPETTSIGLGDPLLDPKRTTSEDADEACRAVGVDPVALGERGVAFVKVAAAERAVVEAAVRWRMPATVERWQKIVISAERDLENAVDALAAARKGGG